MSLRLFCLIAALFSPVLAEGEKPAAKKSESGIEVKFLAEVVPDSLGKMKIVSGKTQSTPFDLPTDFLSQPVMVQDRTMVLKTAEKDIPLCSITLPETGSSFAVVLVTAKPSGYQPIIVRSDDPAFKAGDVFFINRSEKTVLGKLGTAALTLKPGQTTISRPAGPRGNAFYDIAFATREEAGDKLISSTRWPIDNLLRSYVFFFTNAQGKTTFRAVDEYLTAPVAAKP